MNKASERCGIFPQEGMPGGFPLTDLYTSCQSQGQHVLQTASPVFLLLLKGTEECVSRKRKVIYRST